MDRKIAVLFSWFLLLTFIVTRCHASVDGRDNLLESMKERLEFLEKHLQMMSTHVQLETLEKKLELYIVKNEKLFQENQAYKQCVETLEDKHSELAFRVEMLTTDVTDMQKQIGNCQTEVHKLTKEHSSDFVSNQNVSNTNPAKEQRAIISNQGKDTRIRNRIGKHGVSVSYVHYNLLLKAYLKPYDTLCELLQVIYLFVLHGKKMKDLL